MKRRDFFKKSLHLGIGAGAFLAFGSKRGIYAAEKETGNAVTDLVAIKGGEPDVMFDQAIQAMGGIKKFVRPNQTVVVKPNIGWDVSPERAGNTHPALVKQIIKQCLDAGAKDVYVFDHTCDNWVKTYTNSGIESAAKAAGGKVVPGNTEKYYQKVEIPGGIRMTEAKVHELILESDVFINVPILKNHGSATLTMAMKNLMGVVWDRQYWHRNDLHQCIADFAAFRKPDLNVVDAYYVMKKNGPRGISKGDVVTLKSQILSTDIVAADAAAAKLFGMEPAEISHITQADAAGVGKMDLTKSNIRRIVL